MYNLGKEERKEKREKRKLEKRREKTRKERREKWKREERKREKGSEKTGKENKFLVIFHSSLPLLSSIPLHQLVSHIGKFFAVWTPGWDIDRALAAIKCFC